MNWCPPPVNALWWMGGLMSLLVVASTAVYIVKKLQPGRDHTELVQRIRSWWIIVGPFLAVLLICRGIAIVFFGFVSYLALKEYFSLIPTRRADRRVLFWPYHYSTGGSILNGTECSSFLSLSTCFCSCRYEWF